MPRKPKPIDIDLIDRALSYDPEDGLLRWKIKRTRAWPGKVFGSVHNTGYVTGLIYDRSYLCHRLAWALHYGEQPPTCIDHVDGDKTNNRISNLRGCTVSQNLQNVPVSKNSVSGRKGVCWNKAQQKWQASIKIDGKLTYLGLFDDLDAAGNAYVIAARELHGDFFNPMTSVEAL